MKFSIFELIMLACFGASWPFAVIKTWRTKNVKGKSLLFLILIFIGYCSGVLHKIFYKPDWVLSLYILNGIMVCTDLCLYFKYKKN